MPTIQNLKKKLQVIHSTRKITQAMKTASTVKFSKMATLYSDYAKYEEQCNRIYQVYRKDFNAVLSLKNPDAPVLYILLSSNRGMCGSFNTELFSFFESILRKEKKSSVVICCGKKGKEFLDNKKISYKDAYIFEDVPGYSDVYELFGQIKELIQNGDVSDVKIVHPQYTNMMKQTPVSSDLFVFDEGVSVGEEPLFFPDKQAVILGTAEKIFVSILYKKVLETALGAQAATLTTMRSAYDTACEYSAQLETQINRKRQSQVTADVIEISSEYSMKEGE
ncbi:MAG: F0F1 ATP synthase subunit gamma [Clostridia bacterium]|nr:F0F1 ATP synthase subunit gamma [Clostridia bacterium]